MKLCAHIYNCSTLKLMVLVLLSQFVVSCGGGSEGISLGCEN